MKTQYMLILLMIMVSSIALGWYLHGFFHRTRLLKKHLGKNFDGLKSIGAEGDTIFERCQSYVVSIVSNINEVYNKMLMAFINANVVEMQAAMQDVEEINQQCKALRASIYPTVYQLQEESVESSLFYIQITDYLREAAHCLTYIGQPLLEYQQEKSKPLKAHDAYELENLCKFITDYLTGCTNLIQSRNFGQIDHQIHYQQQLLVHIRQMQENQIRRVKKEKSGVKVSVLYISLLRESQSLVLHIGNLLKGERDFVNSKNNYTD